MHRIHVHTPCSCQGSRSHQLLGVSAPYCGNYTTIFQNTYVHTQTYAYTCKSYTCKSVFKYPCHTVVEILLINHFNTSITVQVCNLYTCSVDRAESSVGRSVADSVWVCEPVSPILSINSMHSNISGALDVSIHRQCRVSTIPNILK